MVRPVANIVPIKKNLTDSRFTIAFQTAVSLAEYHNEKDSEGKIKLTEAHLKSVVELSKDFKEYLDELHTGDEAKRARVRKERLDDFGI